MADCTYNKAGATDPRTECGKPAIALYRSTQPDASGRSEHPRCVRHDTEAAKRYVQTHSDLTREEL